LYPPASKNRKNVILGRKPWTVQLAKLRFTKTAPSVSENNQ